MSKPSLAEFVPLAFIQETGSVIQWFKMPKEERLNYWKRSIEADPMTRATKVDTP